MGCALLRSDTSSRLSAVNDIPAARAASSFSAGDFDLRASFSPAAGTPAYGNHQPGQADRTVGNRGHYCARPRAYWDNVVWITLWLVWPSIFRIVDSQAKPISWWTAAASGIMLGEIAGWSPQGLMDVRYTVAG